MTIREAAFTGQHASFMPSGASVIVDTTVMNDLLQRLQHGDPTRGWEGDPRLSLAYNRPEDRWELWRWEWDGEYRLVMRSKPGHPIPLDVIDQLVLMDRNRGFDVSQYVRDHNERVDREQEYQFSERMGPKYEKLQWALRKDDRTGAGV